MKDAEPNGTRSVMGWASACASPAGLVALVILLPLLGKAFTIDDVTFLLQARHVLTDPLHPTAFDMVFHGVPVRLSHEMVTGPVMAYLLVPAVLLGGAEWAAHAVQIALLLVGTVATAALAIRLGLNRAQAALASMLIVASPAVLGMSATAMPDVPAMAFAAAGMERLAAWRHNRQWAAGASAALLLALAALSRPHVLLVLPCAAVWLGGDDSARRRPLQWASALASRSLIPLAGALALAAIVVYATRDPASGVTITAATVGRVGLQTVAFNLASFPLQWMVAFPLGLLWIPLAGGRFLRSHRTPVSFNLGIVLAWIGGHFGAWTDLPVVILVGVGTAVLADIIGDAWERRDRVQLMLGFWLLISAAAAGYVHLPPKLLVPSAPAMAILIARLAGGRLRDRMPLRWIGAVVTAGLIIGLLVIRADAVLAEIGRTGGQVVAEEVKKGERVWMDGAWGFQWYAMKAGARPLAEIAPFPAPGDVVVAGLQARLLREKYPDKTLLSQRLFDGAGGRVHGEGAGFFTNWAGPWPWVWGHGEIGRIEAWRIDPPAAAAP